jgi:hypothetical protein
MKMMLQWLLLTLLAMDCGAYVWGLRRWMRFLQARRLPEMSPEARALALSTPEYRRLRSRAKLPVTLAALIFVALMMVARL